MQFPFSFWSSSFSPLDVAGILFWYTGDTGITLNGTDVSAIADQSGVNLGVGTKTLNESTAAQQPAYNVSGVNGHATLEFADVDLTGLGNEVNGWTLPSAPVSTFSFFFVAKTTVAADQQTVWSGQDAGAPARWALGLGLNESGWHGPAATPFAPIVIPLNTFISRSYIKSAVDWNVYQNGVLQLAAVPDVTAMTTFGGSSTGIGNEGGGGAPYGLTGSIAEVLAYQVVVSTADRLRIEEYLRAKYALY